jgi:hypothetical protein
MAINQQKIECMHYQKTTNNNPINVQNKRNNLNKNNNNSSNNNHIYFQNQLH